MYDDDDDDDIRRGERGLFKEFKEF